MSVFSGVLYDGRTARRHPVRVEVDGRLLRILDPSGGLRDEWSLGGLRLAARPYRGEPVRLAHRDRGDARLTVEARGILDALGGHAEASRLRRRARPRHGTAVRLASWGGVFVVVIVVTVLGLPRLAGPLATAMPDRWAAWLGRTTVHQVAPPGSVCRGDAGRRALQGLLRRLAPARHAGLEVVVADRDIVNALAAPGGRLVLFRGLIEEAGSAEEVAGVLAHEVAHALERHPLERVVRSTGRWLILSTLLGDSPAASLGETMVRLRYSRRTEAAADRLAMRLLREAGIDSHGLPRFLTRLREVEALADAPAFLSTHPAPDRRIAALEPLARHAGPALSAEEWDALRRVCRLARGSVPPGGSRSARGI